MKSPPDLYAAYWTLAGDIYPQGASEISPFPIEDRIEAAARAGYKGMGFLREDLEVTEKRIDLVSVRKHMRDAGLNYTQLEILVDWYRDGDKRSQSDAARDDLFRMADALNAQDIKIGPSMDDLGVADISRMRDGFGELCRAAAPHGLTIALEFMPFTNVNTISDALAIVSGAGESNGGLLVDSWHVDRGNIALSEIGQIPREYVKAIEMVDADEAVIGDLFNDSSHYRRLCGEGAIDLGRFIAEVEATGYDGPVGVEMISAAHRRNPSLDDMARRSFQTAQAQFELSQTQQRA